LRCGPKRDSISSKAAEIGSYAQPVEPATPLPHHGEGGALGTTAFNSQRIGMVSIAILFAIVKLEASENG